ncbi:MAG: M20/M25/M40 family metallo-hydrolase [Solirubrobacteraceae bacterium]
MLTPDANVTELFLELVRIPSPSGHERAVADEIRAWLAAAGVDTQLDGAGARNDSDAGNLIATVPGTPGAPTLLFVAHMDTVEAGARAVVPVVGDDGVIRSDGATILGADNKAAVAAVMRLCAAAARAGGVAGAPTVIGAFTCREESGRMGASLLDGDLLERIDCAFCVDGAKPVGTAITRALGQTAYSFTVHGRTAHAAANPEAGINAIRVAAEIVAELELGRLPGGGSASVAAIVGGGVIDRLSPGAQRMLGIDRDAGGAETVSAALAATATNSIPELTVVRGEVRGFTEDEMEGALDAVRDTAQRICEEYGATCVWARDPARAVPPFPGAPGSRALELARRGAAKAPGITFSAEQRHATLEANHLAAATDVVALATGSRDPHQLTESIPVAELEALERLLLAIVAEATAS